MVILTLIANISRASLELQFAFCFFFFLPSANADFQSSWSEVWRSGSYSVCGFACLDSCLDVNVGKGKKKSNTLTRFERVSAYDHSCLLKMDLNVVCFC